MPRVLVYTPTYNNGLQPETAKSVEAMQFDSFDWVVSDENPYPGRDMRNVVFQFNKGRRLTLDGGYDAMLTVEHDMIVPTDALARLWTTPAPVVYGSYMLRHGMYAVNLFRYEGAKNIGMSLSLYPRELRAAQQRGWIEVSGAGFGCTLMRREALEKCPFRDVGNAPDLPFAHDCVQRGIRQIGRTDVACGHIDDENNQRVLWPYVEGVYGMIARVLANQDVTVSDNGNSVVMRKGKYYSMGLESALEAQRAGYVRITNEADLVVGEMERAVDPNAENRERAVKPTTRRRRKGNNAA